MPVSPFVALKALGQLGIQPVALNALYRFGLASGHYRRLTARPPEAGDWSLQAVLPLPGREDLSALLGRAGKSALLKEADEVAGGKVRLFGGEPVPLQLAPQGPLQHWTAYERGQARIPESGAGNPDVKFVWEPARFGWAFTLGRAYRVSGDEKYALAFWQGLETFLDANPPYLGPHWMSAQEVAIRLMAFVWASQVFADARASTPGRQKRLAEAVAAHAARIPITLVYARSQNNNHLLSEAAGLFTAGLALPGHPQAARWRLLGWKWFNAGLQSQIDGYGEYTQHSANYHRLMLQLALWVNALHQIAGTGRYFPHATAGALARAVHWLLALLDPAEGRVPNLGANDGAYIFPMTIAPFADYRPVLYAAARAFLDYDLPHGPWDELSLWSGVPLEKPKYMQLPRYVGDHIYGVDSWAYFRTAQFNSRPSHADQLHVDLWWRGLNVARDAGTYLYNAPPPWDNPLVTAFVHNTVTLDGRDQMTRAGRFLYLDWFNAYRKGRIEADANVLQCLSARHYGYMRHGVRHTRNVTAFADGRWQVADEMLVLRPPWERRPLRFRLHWLLPDWEWELAEDAGRVECGLASPHGKIRLVLSTGPRPARLQTSATLVRAGERLYGPGEVLPVMGWFSPTYGVKLPALSLALEVLARDEVAIVSDFIFPTSGD